jgi:hypothetical protein
MTKEYIGKIALFCGIIFVSVLMVGQIGLADKRDVPGLSWFWTKRQCWTKRPGLCGRRLPQQKKEIGLLGIIAIDSKKAAEKAGTFLQ